MPARIIGMIGTQQEGVAVHLIKGQISRQWVIDFTRLHAALSGFVPQGNFSVIIFRDNFQNVPVSASARSGSAIRTRRAVA